MQADNLTGGELFLVLHLFGKAILRHPSLETVNFTDNRISFLQMTLDLLISSCELPVKFVWFELRIEVLKDAASGNKIHSAVCNFRQRLLLIFTIN